MQAEIEKVLPSSDHWSRSEVDETAFRDARLGRRFGDLLCRLSDRMGGTIPLACQDWASTKAAYRFFSNPKVEEGNILAGHLEATKARYAASDGPILVLQDTTEFTYQRRNPHDVGFTKSINSGRDKNGRLRHHAVCGILMHFSLVVTEEGLPLGLGSSRRSIMTEPAPSPYPHLQNTVNVWHPAGRIGVSRNPEIRITR